MKKHTFAICAYKDSPFLESCMKSLKGQTVPSDVILCTSTPSPYINRLCEKYGIPMFVRDGQSDIREDWNFAFRMAQGEYVTIAHQDDMYHSRYGRYLYESLERYGDLSLFTTAYRVVKEHRLKKFDLVALIKSLLRLPLRGTGLAHLPWVKKSTLVFGNPICCPSCTYRKSQLGENPFSSTLTFALDWEVLLGLAGREGRFVCVEKPLVYYRIHGEAATKACIGDHRRFREEMEIFGRIWPKPAVKVLMYFYKLAYGAYD